MPHSTLEITALTSLAAQRPTSSFVPRVVSPKYIASGVAPDQTIPADIADRMACRSNHNAIIYKNLDSYSRSVSAVTQRVAVLENRWLRATILLELGARLWSLQRVDTGEELLFQPDRMQFTNQGICNAWFCGGIEWNIGILGHSPLTCQRLAAGKAWLNADTPVLRLSEVERARQTPFQIDLWLDPASPRLLSRIAMANPNDSPVPMYWWTNIAMPQQEGSRVLTPATHAYVSHYDGAISRKSAAELPHFSYPDQMERAGDYFYEMPADRPPWIAAVDRNGSGLIQQSTDRLSGRKLFVWGQQQSAKRWHDWLGCDRHPYFEIQAGLTPTQYEYLQMPAGARWEWLESYRPLEVNPDVSHQSDFASAAGGVESAVNVSAERDTLQHELVSTREMADRPVTDVFQTASGFAELESIRLAAAGGARAKLPGSNFALTQNDPAILPWLELKETGRFHANLKDWSEPLYWPLLIDSFWSGLLHDSLKKHGRRSSPAALLTYAICAFTQQQWDVSEQYATLALGTSAQAHAMRLLGWIHRQQHDHKRAMIWFSQSLDHHGSPIQVLDEAMDTAVVAGDLDTLALIRGKADAVQLSHPRLRIYDVYEHAANGRIQAAMDVLEDPSIVPADQREGETRLTDLWLACSEELGMQHAQPPAFLDFRLTQSTHNAADNPIRSFLANPRPDKPAGQTS